MAENGISDYFISDAEDDALEDDDELIAPVVVPVPREQAPAPESGPQEQEPQTAADPAPQAAVAAVPAASQPPAPTSTPAPVAAQARAGEEARPASREDQLVRALDALMQGSPDVQAAALVSLDGFTMASALPPDMQEDRVGAMSAAILGLGERAAAELGRGRLSQVFIEGNEGYVLLMSAGDRAVLTVLADKDAKLGLVLYDMRTAAEDMGRILG